MFIPTQKQSEKITGKFGSPIFVTEYETIQKQAQKVQQAFSDFKFKAFYAIKANFNPEVVKAIKESGIYGIDAVSPQEVELALKLGYITDQIIFTPSNPSTEEIKQIGQKGILQNLGSISEIRRFGENFPGGSLSIRICPEVGAGETDKVTTGQTESKFGISLENLNKVKEVASQFNLKIIGIHSHIGSGFYQSSVFKKSVQAVCKVALNFPNVEFLDFGGGFGVQYQPEKEEINLKEFASEIKPIIEKFEKETEKEIEIRIEPGKYLVTHSTALLTKITTIKEKNGEIFVGVDSGFNHLIRPAMYGSYHHIANVSKPNQESKTVQVAGNVCETCDVFNSKINLNNPEEGDILAILCAGGYGASMSSNYNLRPRAAESMIKNDSIQLTRKRESLKDILSLFTI